MLKHGALLSLIGIWQVQLQQRDRRQRLAKVKPAKMVQKSRLLGDRISKTKCGCNNKKYASKMEAQKLKVVVTQDQPSLEVGSREKRVAGSSPG